MKKKLSLFLAAIMLLMATAGCSADGQAFWKENSKFAKWEAYSQTGKGSISMDFQGEKMDMAFTIDSTYNTKDLTGLSTIHFTSSDPKMKLPDMEMYLDKGIPYINKGYFTGVFTLNGQEVPAPLADLKADYIGFDGGVNLGSGSTLAPTPDMNQFIQKISDPAKQEQLTKALESTFQGVDVPVQKAGSTYTIKMNSDQLLDMGVQAMDALVTRLPSLSKDLELDLPKKEMDELLASYKKAKAELPAQMETAKQMIKGSKLDMVVTFGDKKVDQNLDMDVVLKDLGRMAMKFSVSSQKTEPKSIAAPGTLVLLTMEEFTDLMMPKEAPLETIPATSPLSTMKSSGALILKNEESFTTPGDVYVDAPIKVFRLHDITYYDPALLFEALGYTGDISKADGIVVKGVPYLSAQGLQFLGFHVEDLGPTLFITR